MRIQDVAGKEAPFHVPSSQGKSLIANRTHVEVLPSPGQRVEFFPNMQFRVMRAAGNSEPWISYSCDGCGMQKGVIMGPEAHLKRIFHCGIKGGDPVPQDVARQYVAILKQRQEARERQKQPSTIKNQPAFSLDQF